MTFHVRALATALVFAAGCTTQPERDAATETIDAATWQSILDAEDARIDTPDRLATVRAALESGIDDVRAMAVRAIGRTERYELSAHVAPLLNDPDSDVRAAAAHALADVSRDSAHAPDSRELLLATLDRADTDGRAQSAIAESLGRLHADRAAARSTTSRITPLLRFDAARPGALRGLFFLARQPAGRAAVASGAGAELRAIAMTGIDARERRLAIATLAAAGALDDETLSVALQDRDPQVRREAAAGAALADDIRGLRELLDSAIVDEQPAVRYDALRAWSRQLADAHGCAPVANAARDTNVHVALLAIDLLGTTCRSSDHVEILDSIAGAGARPSDWHRAGHATVALALTDAQRAGPHSRSLAAHPIRFARARAAQAARAAKDTALLYLLASDTSVIVRTAAVAGLSEIVGHDADSTYIAQLETDDSELLMTAAAALEGSSYRSAPARLLEALNRVTSLRRETSRDGRAALLERIGDVGTPDVSAWIRPYLSDFDERIATAAAGILTEWTDTTQRPTPERLPRLPVPTQHDARRLARSTFVLEMDEGEVALRLLPFHAPTNAARFARLARAGYYDGLTIHRIVPNFVVQGGSPQANEYSGDGPYTRDELGVPNWRGTVGLSTRGRDTGDGQFYINLIDNVRLDHDYTVFAVVVDGMDVVDALAEGAVIRRVREDAR